MGSDLQRILAAAMLVLVACADAWEGIGLDGGEPDGDAGFDVPAGRWYPEAAFLGTQSITVNDPSRCERAVTDTAGNELSDLTFTWEPTGLVRVHAAVFRDLPELDPQTGAIANVEGNVVWAWRTGSGQNDSGAVRWTDGHQPDARGLPDPDLPPPTTLEGDDPLYWFVMWAYDDVTRQLTHGSERRAFFVGAEQQSDQELCCAPGEPVALEQICVHTTEDLEDSFGCQERIVPDVFLWADCPP